MRLFHSIASILLIIIGVIHIAATSITYDSLSLDAYWFAGTGLAIIFTGLVDFLFLINWQSKSSYRIAQLVNVLLLTLVMMINMELTMIPGIMGAVILILLILTSWKIHSPSLTVFDEMG